MVYLNNLESIIQECVYKKFNMRWQVERMANRGLERCSRWRMFIRRKVRGSGGGGARAVLYLRDVRATV